MEEVSVPAQKPETLIPPETIEVVVRTIEEKFAPQQVIIFGSYGSGRPTPDSDLDLLVVMETALPRHKRATPIRLAFRPAPCAMDILVYTPAEVAHWKGTVNHIITEVFRTGRVVYDEQQEH